MDLFLSVVDPLSLAGSAALRESNAVKDRLLRAAISERSVLT